MANKREFYWIKLRDTFFSSDKVDFLMSQKDGANYIVLYQMLCLKCINNNGTLGRQIGEILIPYDADKITRDMKWFSKDTVLVALELYKKLGLIYVEEDGFYRITDFTEMVGSETNWAIQKRNQKLLKEEREKLGGNQGGTFPLDKEKDIDIDIKEKNIIKKENEIIPPTLDMVKQYCKDNNYNINPENFYDFYESKGWYIGKNKMKDWHKALSLWNRNNQNGGNNRFKNVVEDPNYDYATNVEALSDDEQKEAEELRNKLLGR